MVLFCICSPHLDKVTDLSLCSSYFLLSGGGKFLHTIIKISEEDVDVDDVLAEDSEVL